MEAVGFNHSSNSAFEILQKNGFAL